jgi:hypothetical protein
MAERPRIVHGDYFRFRKQPTSIVGKAYTAPPDDGGGEFITIIDAGTYVGPVEAWLHTRDFSTILVQGYWMNVWAKHPRPTHFAHRIPRREVRTWEDRGWVHRE